MQAAQAAASSARAAAEQQAFHTGGSQAAELQTATHEPCSQLPTPAFLLLPQQPSHPSPLPPWWRKLAALLLPWHCWRPPGLPAHLPWRCGQQHRRPSAGRGSRQALLSCGCPRAWRRSATHDINPSIERLARAATAARAAAGTGKPCPPQLTHLGRVSRLIDTAICGDYVSHAALSSWPRRSNGLVWACLSSVRTYHFKSAAECMSTMRCLQ